MLSSILGYGNSREENLLAVICTYEKRFAYVERSIIHDVSRNWYGTNDTIKMELCRICQNTGVPLIQIQMTHETCILEMIISIDYLRKHLIILEIATQTKGVFLL